MKVAFITYKARTVSERRTYYAGFLHTDSTIKNLRKKGVSIKCIEQDIRKPGFCLPFFSFFIDMFRLCQGMRTADIIYKRHSLFQLHYAIASFISGVPLLLEVNAPGIYEKKFYGGFSFFRKIRAMSSNYLTFKLAREIVVVSSELKSYLKKEFSVNEKKIVVLPNGVDEGLFSGKFDKKKIKKSFGIYNEKIILFNGSFKPWHGYFFLLESFKEIVSQNKYVKLILPGYGNLSDSVKARVKSMGLKNHVILPGFLDHVKIQELLAISDVCVMPYPRLKMNYFSPIKLFEYMVAGKAIVASNQGQATRILKEKVSCLTYKPGDKGEFVEKVVKLLKDTKLRTNLGKNAKKVAKGYTWQKHSEKLLNIFNKVLGVD